MEQELSRPRDDPYMKEMIRVWGPEPQEYRDYLAKQEVVDYEKYLGHDIGITPHHRYFGDLVLTPLLTRGVFELKNFQLRPDDVILASFPKSGTTWLQELGHLIMSELDFETAKIKSVDERCPYMEWPECTFKVLQEAPSPRIMKAHLPYRYIPGGDIKKQCKVVYLVRNPKDVAVSIFHMYKMLPLLNFKGTMNDCLEMFLTGTVPYGPFGKNVLEYWEASKEGKVLFMKYEDLIKEPAREIERLAKYLGKNLTDDQIQQIVEASSFSKMQKQQSKNHDQWETKQIKASSNFMRKGKIGDWKNHMDEEMVKRFDEYIEKNFGHSDLKFEYE